ncbi:MAG TPA: tRNA lysidine(34) synthetase TilS [Candidatus Saccharimonadales bacterium]|nr:tRNA lysidine(34) synthetase TilS [Candidatus Saccharimonadales bacterium]
MDVDIGKGKYVAAISGGVDSIVLLDLLSKLDGVVLVVAHFNHGIRPDSEEDEELVRQTAEKYGLFFEAGYGYLGAGTSEEKARTARYKFLMAVKKKYQADKIITAHHQDDLLETAFINIIRGTGRRGLTAISDNPGIIRPLLDWAKKDIIAYAKKHSLKWRTDPTNDDVTLLRNYVRRRIIPALSARQRRQMLNDLKNLSGLNRDINLEIAKMSQNIVNSEQIDRNKFISLPSEIANEVMMYFLRSNGIKEFDKPAVERLAIAVKTAKPGTKHDISRGAYLEMFVSKALLKTTVNR